MDKVRLGVVGTSFISDWVIAGARQDECFEPVAACSRTQEAADAFVSKYDTPYTFISSEKVAKSSLINAVCITSPNFLRASQSILCASYGKHILCEKPFASNTKKVHAMAEIPCTYNVTLVEAMKSTLTPNFLVVRENFGRVGMVRRYSACYCQYSSRYDKSEEGVVLNAFKPELSNGAMMDIDIYMVYPMVILFGHPKKINTSGIALSSGVDGQGAMNFLCERTNAMVLYSKTVNSALPTGVQGEEGNLTLDRTNIIRKMTYFPCLAPAMGKGPRPIPEDLGVVADKDEYYHEIMEFINLVLSGKRESEISNLNSFLITLEVIDEACW